MKNIFSMTACFLALCCLLSSCNRQDVFHYHRAGPNALETDSENLEMLQSYRQMAETYEIGKSVFVELYPVSEEITESELLLQKIRDEVPAEGIITAYRDDLISITCLEPRYSKMLFHVLAIPIALQDVQITFEFDTGDVYTVDTPFVAAGIQTRSSVPLPEDANRVRVRGINLCASEKKTSCRYRFGADFTETFKVVSGNTIHYNCENTVILVFGPDLVVGDMLHLDGKGECATIFGPKYFMFLEDDNGESF